MGLEPTITRSTGGRISRYATTPYFLGTEGWIRAQAVDMVLAKERNRWFFGIAQLGGVI